MNNFNPEDYCEIDEFEGELSKSYNYVEMLHGAFNHVIAPEFKRRGFKKKGKTFYRERNELIEVCNVQYSRGNHSSYASFVYNISVSAPYLFDSMRIPYTNRLKATICECRICDIVQWQKGLGFTNYWYELIDSSSEEESFVDWSTRYNVETGEGFAQVIIEDIEEIIIKFFDLLSEESRLLNYMESLGVLKVKAYAPFTDIAELMSVLGISRD